MKKRLISLLLVLTMVLAMVPMVLAGEEAPEAPVYTKLIVNYKDCDGTKDIAKLEYLVNAISDENGDVFLTLTNPGEEFVQANHPEDAFKGWSYDMNSTVGYWDVNLNVPAKVVFDEEGVAEITLYAVWGVKPTPVAPATICYHVGYGAEADNPAVKDAVSGDAPYTLRTAAPWTIEGQTFKGWTTDFIGAGAIATKVDADDFDDTGICDVFGVWEPEEKPVNNTVTYYVGSTEVTMTPTLKDGKFKLPTLSELGLSAPAGKTFKYWRKYEGNGVYNAGEKITFIEGLKFTAVFEEKYNYYVTFYANDGSSASASCTYSELSTKYGYVLPTASELGLDYGWYKNGKYYYGNDWYFDGTYYYTPYFWDNNYTSYKGGYYYYTAKNFEKYCLPYLYGFDCYGYYNCSFVCWNTRSDGKGTNYYANKVYSSIPSTLYAVWTYDSFLSLPFVDVSANSWYYDAVANVYYRGLMDGVSKTKFDPNGLVDRGMLVTVLWRYAGKPYVNYANAFKDVRTNYYYEDAIDWASSKKIVEGFSATEFGPDRAITREQLAAILWRYAGCPKSKASLVGYADAGNISTYAYPAMQWAVENGIIKGSGSYLMPQDNATRAQVAAMFSRMN